MELPVIGIDLGVTAPSELAVASGAAIESTRRVPSTPKGLVEGIRKAAKGRTVALVVESTAMAWFVAAVAAVRAGVDHTLYRVSGAKAAALRAFYRAHTKTDRIDSRVLARMPQVDDALREFTLPAPAELALKRLVVLRHKLTTEATRVVNRIRSTLHWAAPGLVRAAGGSVSAGLIEVLRRWPDLRNLATAGAASIARTAGWKLERAEAVRAAAAEAAAFYEGFVDFADLALELEVAVSQRDALEAQVARLEARIARLHEALYPEDHLLTVPGSVRWWPGSSGRWWGRFTGSEAWPASGPTPGSSPGRTPRGSPAGGDGSPRPDRRCSGGPCTSPPMPPASATPLWPTCTGGSWWSADVPTPRPCAPWPPTSLGGSGRSSGRGPSLRVAGPPGEPDHEGGGAGHRFEPAGRP